MNEKAWSEILSVDIEEIDDDHRKLIEIFNLLVQSSTKGDPPDYVAAVLQELINFTAWHFSHEERLMLKYGYEAYAEHLAMHRELIKAVAELQTRLLQTDMALSDDDVVFLERWLTEHILTDDKRLGAYLVQVM